MTDQIKEIVKRGTWLYDETVRAEILIVRRNYFDGPEIPDDEKTPGYPPTDAEGCFYALEYDIPGGGRGGGGRVFGSLADAVQNAVATIKSPVAWQD